MRTISKIVLAIAKKLPYGYFKVIRYAADRDPALHNYEIPLSFSDEHFLIADLRESVYTGVLRSGHIPHQVGFDKICRQIIKPGDTVFDVGANVGYTALLFSHLVGKQGKVIALEPIPKAFNMLKKSTEKHKNIECLNLAVGERDGSVQMHVPSMLDRARVLESRATEESDKGAIEVECVALKRLYEQFGSPNFIKIDVEGFEDHIIRGLPKKLDKLPYIVFESLDAKARDKNIAMLMEKGFCKFHRISKDGRLVDVDCDYGSSDYIAVP